MQFERRILGVDPGSLSTGWGLLEGDARRPLLVDAGVIRLASSRDLPARLARLAQELERLLERFQPSGAAVEAPFSGAGARSSLQLAHARGVVLATLARAGVEIAEYAPAAVKKTVTGNGRADKAQVAAMVARLLRAEVGGTLQHDRSDALAVALCHLTLGPWNRLAGASRGGVAVVRRRGPR